MLANIKWSNNYLNKSLLYVRISIMCTTSPVHICICKLKWVFVMNMEAFTNSTWIWNDVSTTQQNVPLLQSI